MAIDWHEDDLTEARRLARLWFRDTYPEGAPAFIAQYPWLEEKLVDWPPPAEKQWEATDLYCPYCGKQPVEAEVGEGDCEVGPVHRCMSCRSDFYMP